MEEGIGGFALAIGGFSFLVVLSFQLCGGKSFRISQPVPKITGGRSLRLHPIPLLLFERRAGYLSLHGGCGIGLSIGKTIEKRRGGGAGSRSQRRSARIAVISAAIRGSRVEGMCRSPTDYLVEGLLTRRGFRLGGSQSVEDALVYSFETHPCFVRTTLPVTCASERLLTSVMLLAPV